MSFLDRLISEIAPHDCVACGAEGQLLCPKCLWGLAAVPERCYRCYKFSPAWLTCLSCRQTSGLHGVRVVTVYDGIAKSLIWKLKLAGARTAARLMAERMEPLVERTAATIIVPVPTVTSRARQRGYDQAKLLARELAHRTRAPYIKCLARMGQAHQHGLPRRQRLVQLDGVFRLTRARAIQDAHVILVDDVVTTGATLEVAAAVLRTAGAARVDAIAFAQPDK